MLRSLKKVIWIFVLASVDESLKIVMTEEDVNTEEFENLDRIAEVTFVKEDNVF